MLMILFGLANILHPAIALGMIGALIGIISIAAGSSLLSVRQISWFW